MAVIRDGTTSTSTAAVCEVPLSTIMDNSRWSNATAFSQFYKKPIIPAGSLRADGQVFLEKQHVQDC